MKIKGIMIDMGETLVHNIGMDFKKSLEYMYEMSSNCIKNKNDFINDSMNILQNIFDNRTNLEFKMIEYIKLIIDLFGLEINKSLEQIEEDFAFKSCEIEFVEDAENILKYFKNKNYPIVLLSNTSFSKNVVVKMLNELNVYFDEIIVSSETVFRKPDKHFFEYGMRKFLLNKKDIYYIGNDYYYDVYGAYNSGICPIWFNEINAKADKNFNVKEYIEIKKYKELIDLNF